MRNGRIQFRFFKAQETRPPAPWLPRVLKGDGGGLQNAYRILTRGSKPGALGHRGRKHLDPNKVTAKVEAKARPEAPWSERAKAMADQVIDSVARRGLVGDAAIVGALRLLLRMSEAEGASVSVAVKRSGAPSPMFAHDLDVPLNPASNAKLATATFALGVLGPDYRFRTSVQKDAAGNLYITGGFDPTLTSSSLVELAKALKAKGITQISGDVVLDNGRFSGERTPAGFAHYDDEDWAYLARPEALSVNKNLLEIVVTPGRRPGDLAETHAPQGAFELRSKVSTIDKGEEFRVGVDEQDEGGVLIRNDQGKPIIDIWGTIAADYDKGKKLVMKSPDPVAGFQDQLKRAFEEAGVKVTGRYRVGPSPEDAELCHDCVSAPLAEILQTSISTSNAFDHEMFALAAAAHLAPGGVTSLDEAQKWMETFLTDELGLNAPTMANASGIGNLDRLSAGEVAKLLENAVTKRRYAPLVEGLAEPGETGTLKTRMLGTPAEGGLKAKTGTGKGAVALSGVVDARSSPIVFSCLINDYSTRSGARALLDALGIVLASCGHHY